ncbi:dsDNA nuclease domain-containing protein [Kitasatospora purpeofusca]|uniref:dsDNA nuclease domain-containing protein n=1 Tax=Kitasatospora purpeofusca TaxID=67352 RepID=UPI0036D4063C
MVDLAVAEAAEEPDEDDDEGFVHPIFRMAPKEDSGSDTLRNYRYQAEVAARTCLAMLTEENIDYIVCEWHEDFVIAYVDGSVELVSVKHRTKRRNPWNVADICKDGGLAHLFDRWQACDGARNVRLRLATNAGLTTGKTGAATLSAMCGPDPEIIAGVDAMAESVARYFLRIRWKQPYATIPEVPEVSKLVDITVPVGFIDTVKDFFAVLHIDDELPSRGDITDVNLQRLLRPAIATLQRENVDTEATYRPWSSASTRPTATRATADSSPSTSLTRAGSATTSRSSSASLAAPCTAARSWNSSPPASPPCRPSPEDSSP